MNMEDMLRELMKDSKEHGKQIAVMTTKLELMAQAQKTQNETVLLKIGNRLDSIETRINEQDSKFEQRQIKAGERFEKLSNRVDDIENRPAATALERNKLIGKTILVSAATAIGTLIVGILIYLFSQTIPTP